MDGEHRAARWLLRAVLVAAAAAVVVPGFRMALGYDEAYNLQVVTNLLHGHGYATNGALSGGHTQPFDYRITTGPTLMLPIAAAAALLGEHVSVYRLVPTVAFGALLACWWVAGRRLTGRHWNMIGGAAAVLGILSLNTVSLWYDERSGPGSVIGETTATLFVLLAVLLARRPGWAGLCLGLAVMTKVLALLTVPGVALAVVIAAGRARAVRAVAGLGAVAALPVLAWQAVRIVVLGWSRAMATNADFLAFLRGTGAGSPDPGHQLSLQVELQLGVGFAAVLLAVGTVSVRLVRGWRPGFSLEQVSLLVGIGVAGAALEGYWLALESQHAIRHTQQAGQLLVPLALVGLVRAVATVERRIVRDVTVLVGVALVVAQVVVATCAVWDPPGPTLAEQRHVADLVSEHTSTYRFGGISMLPELTLLDPNLEAVPLSKGGGGVLVLSGMYGLRRSDACGPVLVIYARYVLCEVAPDQVTRKKS